MIICIIVVVNVLVTCFTFKKKEKLDFDDLVMRYLAINCVIFLVTLMLLVCNYLSNLIGW